MIRFSLGFLLALNLFAGRPDRYALVLADEPTAAVALAGKTKAAVADHARRVSAAQTAVKNALAEREIRVLGSVHTLVNAVFVSATAEQAEALRSLPGVARVEKMLTYRRTLNRAIDLVNAPAGWNAIGGAQNAGAGIRIGILDSGIDHQHPAFLDPSLPAAPGYPRCAGDDCNYTSNKIIVARSYVDMLASYLGDNRPEVTRPDDLTPRDRVGHGTAVAAVAAGVAHDAPLARISGVAPKAYLGNYKIFGAPGVNDLTLEEVVIAALDDAYNDGMDVVSLSLGAPAEWGPSDSGSICGNAAGQACGLFADAVETAAQKMTIVVSAGDDGNAGLKWPSLNTIWTPGTAPSAITVGASTNSHMLFAAVRVGGQAPANLQRIDALFGDSARPTGTLTGPVRDVSKLGNDGKACAPLGNGTLAGALALVQRGVCDFSSKTNYAQAAGAIGVIVYQSDGLNSIFPAAGMSGTAIPMAMIGYDNGVALLSYLSGANDAPGTLDPSLIERNASYDSVAYFSSHGPSIGDHAIKPELVAVGTDMYMPTQKFDPNGDMYDPSGYVAAQGTSFSAPMVAGAAALVWQRRPGLSAAAVKSALVNSALDVVSNVDGSAKASVSAAGAGKLDVAGALAADVSAVPATLSFGAVSTAATKSLVLTNSGSGQSLQLTLSVVSATSQNNTRVTLSQSSFTLAPGQSAPVTVNVQSTGVPQAGAYEGVIAIQGAATPLRVPYLYLVGSGSVYNMTPVKNYDFIGVVNQPASEMMFKLVDQYGLPVANAPVRFTPSLGQQLDPSAPCPQKQGVYYAAAATDSYGIAFADACLGPLLGDQPFTAEAVGTGMSLTFIGRALLQPAIQPDGVVNAASGRIDAGLAPGSYVSIFGAGLSQAMRVEVTPSLPLSLAGVSVSFDVPERSLSLPGRLHFVSPGQINVQIPWEFEGLSTVKMKVSYGWNIQTAVYDVPLAQYSPGIFEYPEASSGRTFASVLDQDYKLVGTPNPARRGQVIQIYCNGLGPVNNGPSSGEPSPAQTLATTKVVPEVNIGGRSAQVVFNGLAPGLVGLYQVNAVVPLDAPAGIQPLIVAMEGNSSKTASLPIQ